MVWADGMKDITGNVFEGRLIFNPHSPTPGFQTWSDNLLTILDIASGYYQAIPGAYNRTYTICPVADAYNPHIINAGTQTTWNDSVWDAPVASFVDDAIQVLGGASAQNVSIQRCLSLPRLGGNDPGVGVSLGYLCGMNTRYDHNTVAIGTDSGRGPPVDL